jgi:hypothetical protein
MVNMGADQIHFSSTASLFFRSWSTAVNNYSEQGLSFSLYCQTQTLSLLDLASRNLPLKENWTDKGI